MKKGISLSNISIANGYFLVNNITMSEYFCRIKVSVSYKYIQVENCY